MKHIHVITEVNFPLLAYITDKDGNRTLKKVWAKKVNKFTKRTEAIRRLPQQKVAQPYNIPTTYTGTMKPIGEGDYSQEIAYRNKSRRLANEVKH